MKRSDIPEEVLQEVLPNLLANHRSVALKACEIGLLKWEEVHPTCGEWHNSVRLSMMALRRGLVQDLKEIPKLTKPNMANALKQDNLQWDRIPTCLQDDEEFCRLVLDPEGNSEEIIAPEDDSRSRHCGRFFGAGAYSRLVKNIFDHHSGRQLRHDRQVWEKLIMYSGHRFNIGLSGLFEEDYLPPNADLIEHACNNENLLLTCIDQLAYADVVRNVINKNANALFNASEPFIEANQDFVTSKLAELRLEESDVDPCKIGAFAEQIPATMWANDDFVHAWFRVGRLPLVASHPRAWRSDPQKLLLVAELCPKPEWKLSSFRYASEALKGDITFVTRAMQLEPCLFEFASQELRGDKTFVTRAMQLEPRLFEFASEAVRHENYELAVWAMGDRQFMNRCFTVIRHAAEPQLFFGSPPPIILTEEKMNEYLKRVGQEVCMHNAFAKEFLCAVCISDEHQTHPGLRMLNQEPLLKAIADFVGIARENHLRNIRKAFATASALMPEFENQFNGGKN